MNIVHLVCNKVWGGDERYVLDLCRRSAEAGHSVAVITRGARSVDAPFTAAGFAPGHLPLRGVLDKSAILSLPVCSTACRLRL